MLVKRVLFVLLVFVFAIAMVSPVAAQTVTPAPVSQTFELANGSLTLNLPDGWSGEVETAQSNGLLLMLYSSEAAASGLPAAGDVTGGMMYIQDTRPLTAVERLLSWIAALDAQMPFMEQAPESMIEAIGVGGVGIVVHQVDRPASARMYAILPSGDGFIIALFVVKDGEFSPKVKAAIEAMLASASFVPSEPATPAATAAVP